MRRGHTITAAFVLAAAGVLAGCPPQISALWCRADDRSCYQSRRDCVHTPGTDTHLTCAPVRQAYCFVVLGAALEKPGGKHRCAATPAECELWRQTQAETVPDLYTGWCRPTGA